MSMKKNAKEIINLILIAIMIFVLGFNFVLKPSVIVTNSTVIEKVFNSNRQDVIMAQNPNVNYTLFYLQCDYVCSNQCLQTESNTKEMFVKCIESKCNCKFIEEKRYSLKQHLIAFIMTISVFGFIGYFVFNVSNIEKKHKIKEQCEYNSECSDNEYLNIEEEFDHLKENLI